MSRFSIVLLTALAATLPLTLAAQSTGDGNPRATAPPAITVWYGNEQSFGTIGDPTPAVNILGNVSDPDGVAWLAYTLNGGGTVRLTIGPDSRRLQRPGDFNIDIPYPTLLTGANRVVIHALDSVGTTARETVTVNYARGNTWPANYSVDWSAVTNIQNAAQVVDGLWTLTGSGLRTVQTGYDRFVAIGEGTWDEYEVSVPITIHRIDSSGYTPPSNGCAVGFLLRWPGHSDNPPSLAGRQPKTGYLPFGALGWYHYRPGGEELRIVGNNAVLAARDTTGRRLQMGVEYVFKMRVQTNPGVGGLYSLKVWQSGTPEPPAWDLTAQQTLADPQSGSLLLVAHNADATFGDVQVVSLADTTVPPSTIRSDDFHTGVLDTTLWRFINPLGDGALSFAGVGTQDAWVRFSVPGGVPHQPWTDGNKAPRIMQAANNTDFQIEAKFESPLTIRYQMQGILVEQDADNYLRFDFNSDGSTTRIYGAGLHNGVVTTRANASVAANGEVPLLMRVKRKASQWTFSYSLNAKTWIDAATFVDPLVVDSVGVFGGNAGTPAPAHLAAVDYFFNTALPLVPEDPVSTAPAITSHPAPKTVAVGQTATFSVTASGTPPLEYQWQRNGADIPGAQSPSYTTPALALADSGARFRCRVTNAVGSVTSNAALLRVLAPPAIALHPAGVTVAAGSQASFSVSATGSAPLLYQWQKNGSDIPGADGPSYTTPPVSAVDDGALFRCRVRNEVGSVLSDAALLTVTAGDSGRVTANLLAFYRFDEGAGSVIHDRSGVGTPLDLQIGSMQGVLWGSGFLRVTAPVVIASEGQATKIFNAARAADALTVEAWISPASSAQGNPPARIVGLSSHQNQRNFGFDQALSTYEFRLRTTETNKQGQPYLVTPQGAATTALTHIVYARAPGGDAVVYCNGMMIHGGIIPGTFANWNGDYHLLLANTEQSNRTWRGDYHLVAVYGRALTAGEVARNYAAGPNPVGGGDRTVAGVGTELTPTESGLTGIYPNPFNPSTTIRLALTAPAQVRLAVFNILGEDVAEVYAGRLEAGTHEIRFEASRLPSGVYFCRLMSEGMVQTRRMLLVR